MVTVNVGDFHAALGLKNRFPAVCSALDADKFLTQARVTLVRRSGPIRVAMRNGYLGCDEVRDI
jgi:hypothetical protein